MKKLIIKLFSFLGFYIRKESHIYDAFKMQKYILRNSKDKLVIFDVGAYDGTVSLFYNKLFKDSKIYSFEPFKESFLKLKKNTSFFKNINIFNLGLNDVEGVMSFYSNFSPSTNSILKSNKEADEIFNSEGKLDELEKIDAEFTTIDNFVKINSIQQIDILKIDVQGAEHKVLSGAKNAIKSGVIKMIYMEIILRPAYQGQIHFDETLSLLRSLDFELYNFYDLSLNSDAKLVQLDAIFIKK